MTFVPQGDFNLTLSSCRSRRDEYATHHVGNIQSSVLTVTFLFPRADADGLFCSRTCEGDLLLLRPMLCASPKIPHPTKPTSWRPPKPIMTPERHATPRKAYIGYRACEMYTTARYGKTTKRSKRTFDVIITGERR